MRALGSLGAGPEDATDRLSLLACASDLGPAHPQLALPGAPQVSIDGGSGDGLPLRFCLGALPSTPPQNPTPTRHDTTQLLRWATYDDCTPMKLLERERAFATLGLARLVDPATVALVAAAIYHNHNDPRRRVSVRVSGVGFWVSCIRGLFVWVADPTADPSHHHPTRPPTQPTKQEDEEEEEDGDDQAPGEKEPEPPAWDAYPRGPEWEKEAEANATFLGGLGAIDAVVGRVRYVNLFVPCMYVVVLFCMCG